MFEMFFGSHAASRLFMGFGLLFLAIMTTSIGPGLLLAILASVIIRLLDGNWRTSLRLLYLLRWFVIPIVLLHMLFTPGQLLLPGWPIAVSREGLMQGIRLSIHLSSIYVMAMMMFRLLTHAEWLHLLMLLPRIGERVMVQSFMMMSMKQHMGKLLSYLRQQFQLRHDWKKSPLLLMAAFRQALTDASIHAQMLWLRWPKTPSMLAPSVDKNNISTFHKCLFSGLWTLCGGISLLTPWLL
ncbi:MAG: hypothetical protein Q9M82_01170 [Mariprofundus sp.]|nr:hypothetical protein [Mariprofundus sp.]